MKETNFDSDADFILDEDYYLDEDKVVFTESYLEKRGYCCKNECRHCPWEFSSSKSEGEAQ